MTVGVGLMLRRLSVLRPLCTARAPRQVAVTVAADGGRRCPPAATVTALQAVTFAADVDAVGVAQSAGQRQRGGCGDGRGRDGAGRRRAVARRRPGALQSAAVAVGADAVRGLPNFLANVHNQRRSGDGCGVGVDVVGIGSQQRRRGLPCW